MMAKYSKSYWAITKRIQQLPQIAEPLLKAHVKRDALNLMRNFHTGIKRDTLGLQRLKDGTVRRKQRIGLSRPGVPLYAYGDDKKKNSYCNMLRLRTTKKGYTVYQSWAKHHTSRLKLRDLFVVHEYGTLITVGDKMIRIPPRPAFLRAYEKTVKQRKLGERSIRVRRAMARYVIDAKISHIKKESDRFLEGLERFENRD